METIEQSFQGNILWAALVTAALLNELRTIYSMLSGSHPMHRRPLFGAKSQSWLHSAVSSWPQWRRHRYGGGWCCIRSSLSDKCTLHEKLWPE